MSSYGICCFKKIHSKELEVLILRRRYTYNYCLFVYNNYTSVDELRQILDGTTIEEKLTVMSFDYSKIWGRIFCDGKTDRYNTNKETFEKIVRSIGQDKFTEIIKCSKSEELVWELPKGRKDKYPESDIECACRELCEETGVNRTDYQVIPHVYDHCHFRDHGVMYTTKFWAAKLKDNTWKPNCSLNDTTYHEHDFIKFVPIGIADHLLMTPMAKVVRRMSKRFRKIRE